MVAYYTEFIVRQITKDPKLIGNGHEPTNFFYFLAHQTFLCDLIYLSKQKYIMFCIFFRVGRQLLLINNFLNKINSRKFWESTVLAYLVKIDTFSLVTIFRKMLPFWIIYDFLWKKILKFVIFGIPFSKTSYLLIRNSKKYKK